MLVRANTLSKGYSGVRVEIVQTLLNMLNAGVTPVVPSQGSLGSSGDLCPLSHMALVFTTDEADRAEDSGLAVFQGNVMDGKSAMQQAGLQRIRLGPKEGLALNNGATFSAAIAALNLMDATHLMDVAEISLGMSLEAMLGCSTAFDARLHEVRGHQGQIHVAENVRRLIAHQLAILERKLLTFFRIDLGGRTAARPAATGLTSASNAACGRGVVIFDGFLQILSGGGHLAPSLYSLRRIYRAGYIYVKANIIVRMADPLERLEGVFRALADRTRLRILALLAGGEVCVCEIHESLGLPQPTVSRHLAYLRSAGLVTGRKEGLWVHYNLATRRK